MLEQELKKIIETSNNNITITDRKRNHFILQSKTLGDLWYGK